MSSVPVRTDAPLSLSPIGFTHICYTIKMLANAQPSRDGKTNGGGCWRLQNQRREMSWQELNFGKTGINLIYLSIVKSAEVPRTHDT